MLARIASRAPTARPDVLQNGSDHDFYKRTLLVRKECERRAKEGERIKENLLLLQRLQSIAHNEHDSRTNKNKNYQAAWREHQKHHDRLVRRLSSRPRSALTSSRHYALVELVSPLHPANRATWEGDRYKGKTKYVDTTQWNDEEFMRRTGRGRGTAAERGGSRSAIMSKPGPNMSNKRINDPTRDASDDEQQLLGPDEEENEWLRMQAEQQVQSAGDAHSSALVTYLPSHAQSATSYPPLPLPTSAPTTSMWSGVPPHFPYPPSMMMPPLPPSWPPIAGASPNPFAPSMPMMPTPPTNPPAAATHAPTHLPRGTAHAPPLSLSRRQAARKRYKQFLREERLEEQYEAEEEHKQMQQTTHSDENTDQHQEDEHAYPDDSSDKGRYECEDDDIVAALQDESLNPLPPASISSLHSDARRSRRTHRHVQRCGHTSDSMHHSRSSMSSSSWGSGSGYRFPNSISSLYDLVADIDPGPDGYPDDNSTTANQQQQQQRQYPSYSTRSSEDSSVIHTDHVAGPNSQAPPPEASNHVPITPAPPPASFSPSHHSQAHRRRVLRPSSSTVHGSRHQTPSRNSHVRPSSACATTATVTATSIPNSHDHDDYSRQHDHNRHRHRHRPPLSLPNQHRDGHIHEHVESDHEPLEDTARNQDQDEFDDVDEKGRLLHELEHVLAALEPQSEHSEWDGDGQGWVHENSDEECHHADGVDQELYTLGPHPSAPRHHVAATSSSILQASSTERHPPPHHRLPLRSPHPPQRPQPPSSLSHPHPAYNRSTYSSCMRATSRSRSIDDR